MRQKGRLGALGSAWIAHRGSSRGLLLGYPNRRALATGCRSRDSDRTRRASSLRSEFQECAGLGRWLSSHTRTITAAIATKNFDYTARNLPTRNDEAWCRKSLFGNFFRSNTQPRCRAIRAEYPGSGNAPGIALRVAPSGTLRRISRPRWRGV
jgi:hypothetical protein